MGINYESYFEPLDTSDYPCEVCGEPECNCICPVCPVCGSCGDPKCYIEHGLRRTQQQKFYLECNMRDWQEEAEAEYKYFAWLEALDDEE